MYGKLSTLLVYNLISVLNAENFKIENCISWAKFEFSIFGSIETLPKTID